MRKLTFFFKIVLVSLLLSGCRQQNIKIPQDVEKILEKAGWNRKELEEVISHYQDDSLKLEAAFFLIRNMPFHFGYKGESLDAYDKVFDQIQEYEKHTPFKGNIHFPLFVKWSDSIVNATGYPAPAALVKVYDHTAISSKMLIENIDCAFDAWKFPWTKRLDFETFCNYILPYRFQDEPLALWRKTYMEKFSWLVDSMKGDDDPVLACKYINDDLKKWFRFNEELSVYPSAIGPINLLKAKMGRCVDQAGVANFAMRAMGIPVVHEVIPQWGDRSMGHDFSAVLSKSGKFIDFLGAELPPGENEFRGKAPKVFRQMFPVQNRRIQKYDDGLAAKLGRPFGHDATSEFFQTTDVILPKTESQKQDIFLAVFDDSRWIPVKLGEDSSGKYVFRNMARNIMYLPCMMGNNELVQFAEPLFIDTSGVVHTVNPETQTHSIHLERKYPLTVLKRWWMTLMAHGRFEGSNNSDFSDSRLLYAIGDTIALKFHMSKTKTAPPVRFVRYVFPDSSFGSLGELSFYEGNSIDPLKGKPIKSERVSTEDLQIAFDGKIDKFIHTTTKDDYNGQWLGLDLGSPKVISGVGYSPRNDQNNIEQGMEYELLYWNSGWKSLGRVIAKNDYLEYDKVPVGALLLLRNHTAGKEERIFLYEGRKQIWF